MKKTLRLRGKFCSFPLIATFAIVLLSGCGHENAKSRPAPTVPVQVAIAVKQALPVTQKAIGSVQAQRGVAVKSQVDGIIQSINFQEGDEVKAGGLLVTLDKRPFENSLQMAKADLANARAQATRAATDAERYERLDQASVVSKEQYAQLVTQAQTTKAQVDAKEAAVANAQLQLDYTEIRAPIDGRTGQLGLHEGALVKSNDAAFSLVTINQMAPISVAFSVPERTLDAVRAALAAGSVAAHVSGRDNDTVQADGVVDFIDNTVDPTTGMITLKARFDNADHALWPGRFVNVELKLGTEADQIVVPTPAVQTGQKGKQIYVVKADHTVELRPVTVGRIAGDFTSIATGIEAGDTVVTDGQLRLVPGFRVEVRTLEEAARVPAAKKK
jgi:multidrug efflux system membrane fusion protein